MSYESFGAAGRSESLPSGFADDDGSAGSGPGSSSLLKGGKVLVTGKGGQRWLNPDEKPTPFELDEPNWRGDASVASCMACSTPFSFFVRRHHCRRCGDIFCGDCCATEMPVLRLAFQEEVRVCKTCLKKVEKENEFFNTYIKVLQRGSIFKLVKGNVAVDVLVQLTTNDRELFVTEVNFPNGDLKKATIATSPEAYYQTVPVETLLEVKSVRKQADPSGARSEAIVLKTTSFGEFELSTDDKQQRMVWATSLRKAIELLTNNDFPSTPITTSPPQE